MKIRWFFGGDTYIFLVMGALLLLFFFTGCSRHTPIGAQTLRSLDIASLEKKVEETDEPVFKGMLAVRLMEMGEKESFERAVGLIEPLLETEDPNVLYVTGMKWLLAVPEERDCGVAIRFLSKAAAGGQPEAHYVLGQLYETGECVPQDREKAEDFYAGAAGDIPEALYLLALRHDGHDKRAQELYKEAADKGQPDAAFNLAGIYARGAKDREDWEKAAFYYKKAFDNGSDESAFFLGGLFFLRDNPFFDRKTGTDWYLKAARAGHPEAQFFMGEAFDLGRNVRRDPIMARYWYGMAARNGHRDAQYNLAVTYDRVNATPEELAAAFSWYSQAAKNGQAQAMHNLAVLYAKGWGTTRSEQNAYFWALLAKRHGIREADVLIERIQPFVNIFDQELVEHRARKWKAEAVRQEKEEARDGSK